MKSKIRCGTLFWAIFSMCALNANSAQAGSGVESLARVVRRDARALDLPETLGIHEGDLAVDRDTVNDPEKYLGRPASGKFVFTCEIPLEEARHHRRPIEVHLQGRVEEKEYGSEVMEVMVRAEYRPDIETIFRKAIRDCLTYPHWVMRLKNRDAVLAEAWLQWLVRDEWGRIQREPSLSDGLGVKSSVPTEERAASFSSELRGSTGGRLND